MSSKALLKHYDTSSIVKAIVRDITNKKSLKLKNLSGSYDALLVSQIFYKMGGKHLVILHDKEEADYFFSDLKFFSKENPCVFFPSSYKKPYVYEEIENANILQRIEVLNRIYEQKNLLIITYPNALSEKVVNKKSLISNAFTAKVGDSLDITFLSDFLINYDFEKNDFVYEPGQFSVRGGILDIFSYANDMPYRVELSGNEIESIRYFNVENQLSIKNLEQMTILPNVQTKLITEERQSFLEYIPVETTIWLKDHQQALDIIDKNFQKAQEQFETIKENSGNSKIIKYPNQLFDTMVSFDQDIKKFTRVEFGKRYTTEPHNEIDVSVKPQPSFRKSFELLGENLKQLQDNYYQNYIVAESEQQLNRLSLIFDEIDPSIQFKGLIGTLHQGFIDDHQSISCYTDHQIFDRYQKLDRKEKFTKSKALTLKEIKNLQPGDFIVHIDYGIGRFGGLDVVDTGGNKQEAIRIIYKDDDLLYLSLHAFHKISKYSGKEDVPPIINKLGSSEWTTKKRKIKKKVQDIAKNLIELYAKRKAVEGFAFPPDNYLQAELESSFIYQDTVDQSTATADVKVDMEEKHPMDRLICGDVGFGKTEIAIRAAFKAVNSGKQVAVLVPTTILALQHFHTFSSRLKKFPIKVDYINRFRSAKEITKIKGEIAKRSIDILIGTHRIVSKDISFKDLGLMIVDEEQKFGVKIKEKLKNIKINVDSLTLTATPIPRTLHFSLMGARDLSIISTPPPNRRPVNTELHLFKEEIIRDAVRHELGRGGQVFIVHNRVSDIEKMGNIVYKLVPDASIGIAHGQMEGSQLEKVMLKFIEGNYDILVSTNIIESGLDIPNANTIIINNAHLFGLSDLHQMRGRVGRSNTKAYCYMLAPSSSLLTSDARKRLKILEEFSELGDGFQIAMKDLDIRGAGNLLGAEQSGFINDIGFDMYHKILDETVQELRDGEFKELFTNTLIKDKKTFSNFDASCNIETDFEVLIPEKYVTNISERLSLYTQLDDIKEKKELDLFLKTVEDRFGKIPKSFENLIKIVKLRWVATAIGFEKITIKNHKIRAYISGKKSEEYFQSKQFDTILDFVKRNSKYTKMKEVKDNMLLISVEKVQTIDKSMSILNEMFENN